MADKTRILWIDDTLSTLEFILFKLHTEYETDIYFSNDNAEALELSKNQWDIVLYDIGMDVSRTGYDLPVASKIRQNIGNALFIGDSLVYRGSYKEYFDEVFERSVNSDITLKDFLEIAEGHGVNIKRKINKDE